MSHTLLACCMYNDMFARNEERDLQDDDDERDHNSNMASVIGSCMCAFLLLACEQ